MQPPYRYQQFLSLPQRPSIDNPLKKPIQYEEASASREAWQVRSSSRHPLESIIGSFRDDPLWDAMMEAIKESETLECEAV